MSEPAIENLPQPIPDKLYFRIGEVSRLIGVPHHVLRYWESEFHALGPKKSGKGHRLYRRKDVELLLEIKHLLYEKRFTIEGARKWMQTRQKGTEPEPAIGKKRTVKQTELFTPAGVLDNLAEIRRELRSILDLLKQGDSVT